MNPKEYEKNVLITESCDFAAIKGRMDDRMIRLLHAGLGMSSEEAELSEAINPKHEIDWVNIMEESADLAWYVAVAVNALGFDHEEISSYESSTMTSGLFKHSLSSLLSAMNAAQWSIGNYNDLLKKHLFYGRELNMEKMKETLQQLCLSIAGLCVVSGSTIEEARNTNIKKLKARYGEKFTEAAALNRDLDAERKILEGKEA